MSERVIRAPFCNGPGCSCEDTNPERAHRDNMVRARLAAGLAPEPWVVTVPEERLSP